jgi:amino acid transporter
MDFFFLFLLIIIPIIIFLGGVSSRAIIPTIITIITITIIFYSFSSVFEGMELFSDSMIFTTNFEEEQPQTIQNYKEDLERVHKLEVDEDLNEAEQSDIGGIVSLICLVGLAFFSYIGYLKIKPLLKEYLNLNKTNRNERTSYHKVIKETTIKKSKKRKKKRR